ncbi:DNA helicase ATP-dependent RecQ type [Trinorchestia longiramus]|nr:DNA helicase ATP-dependent RecQ type [Trinorchestia longiramus]
MEKFSLQDYSLAKQAVKAWEREYRSLHDCRPDRQALSAASTDVQAAYSTYYKLRKVFGAGDQHSKDESAHPSNSFDSKQETKRDDPSESISSRSCSEQSSGDLAGSELSSSSEGKTSSNGALCVAVTARESSGPPMKPLCNEIKTKEDISLAMQPVSGRSDNMVNSTDETTCSQEVFGRFLNRPTKDPCKKVDRAPLSDLYSKLAQNMRESFLASPSVPPVKLSLKSRASKSNNKSRDSLKNIATSAHNHGNVNGFNSESTINRAEGVDGKNVSYECLSTSINEMPELSTSIECSVSEKAVAVPDESDYSSLDLFKNSFKIRGVAKRSAAHAINLIPGLALNSGRLSGSINAGWVQRCSKSLSNDDEVVYDFSEENHKLSPDVPRIEVSSDRKFKNMIDQNSSSLKADSLVINDTESLIVQNNSVSNVLESKKKLTRSPFKVMAEALNFSETSCNDVSSVNSSSSQELSCIPSIASRYSCSSDVYRDNLSYTPGSSDSTVCITSTSDSEKLCTSPSISVPTNTVSAVTCTSEFSEPPLTVSTSRGSKRKAEQSLDELEESGKIVSVWPPPKKKRLSRVTRNSEEEIDRHKLTIRARKIETESFNENSKKPMQVRVRRNAKNRNAINSSVSGNEFKAPCHTLPKFNSSAECHTQYEKTSDDVTCSLPRDSTNTDEAAVPEYDEQVELEKISKGGAKRKFLSKEERLNDKVKRGTLNHNFVKIDLKKKTYARGKKTMTGGKYRRMEWKRKQSLKNSSGKSSVGGNKKNLTCHKCGDFGHWAARCPGKMAKMDFTDACERPALSFLTLEEAEDMARGIKTSHDTTTTRIFLPPPGISPSQVSLDSTETENSSTEKCPSDCDGGSNINGMTPPIGETVSQAQDSDDDDGERELIQIEDAANLPLTAMDGDELNESFDIDEVNQLEAVAVRQELLESTSSGESQSSSKGSLNFQKRKSAEPLLPKSITACPREVLDTLLMFGHSSFRPGQETAILRILQGKSTLLVLSTGSGKSLCYQLPAYMYAQKQKCITLCVSPLVSLMEDQVTGLPSFLHAVCLHTNQTPQQRSKALDAVKNGQAHILLVSPEAVVASGAGGVLGTLMKDLPTISFACVDEAHCVSQWSHNFRPSYLRVCSVLRDHLGVRTILGLTATARHETTLSIASHLKVEDLDSGVIRGSSVPPNLLLSVSRDANRNEALIQLLQGDRFANCESIIVYCTRRDECERVATLLRSQLLTTQKIDVKSNLKRNRGISLDAEAYHAGLSASRRRQIQNKFMSGKVRIVVATVAFGMGIDKADVRAIIHYNMPKNLESYVQEIGRAGRDGLVSQCHLFLDCLDGRDVQELKRFIFVNSVDRVTVRKLLDKVFDPCICTKLQNLDTNASSSVANERRTCPKHEVALSVSDLVESLDIPEENILTLLCYLELRDEDLLQLLPSVYGSCTVTCYGGAAQLCASSKRCPPLAVAIAKECQRGISHQTSNSITFPVVQVAAQMGWNSGIVKRELKALEWMTAGGSVRPSGVKVEFSDLSFHLMVRGNLTDDERDMILDELHSRAIKQETDQLKQLQYTHQTLRAASHASILLCCDQVDENRCANLRAAIARYFEPNSTELEKVVLEKDPELSSALETNVRQDVRSLLSTHTDQTWTARAVARVFHGIQSPNFPANVWGRVRRIWRAQINVPFKQVLTIAQQEIIKWRRL